MKTMQNTLKISLISLALISSFSCSKAKQRPETIETTIQGKLVAITSFKDVTTSQESAYFVEKEIHQEIQKLDQTSQITLSDDVKKALNTLKTERSKNLINEALKTNPIAFVVLPNEIKVFRVIKKSGSADEQIGKKALTLADLKTLKKESLEAAQISAKLSEESKDITSEFVEILSLKISKTGVIENKKTKYYDEKMSVLTLAERSIDLSTHVILEDEVVENLKK